MAHTQTRPAPTARLAECQSCDAQVWWVISRSLVQQWIALDAEPDPCGSIEMVPVYESWLASELEQTESLFNVDGALRWRPHSLSCPGDLARGRGKE